jgi:hypothetical protein
MQQNVVAVGVNLAKNVFRSPSPLMARFWFADSSGGSRS